MKIIDCFTFYNEIELLNYRLNILNEFVDFFVLVESTHTHVGKPKDLYFEKNKEKFHDFFSIKNDSYYWECNKCNFKAENCFDFFSNKCLNNENHYYERVLRSA